MFDRPRVLLTLLILAASGLTGQGQRGAPIDPEMACLQSCARPDLFGTTKMDPDCVKKCLSQPGPVATQPTAPGETLPPANNADASLGRFTPIWDITPRYRPQKQLVQRLLGTIGNPPVKSWALSRIQFDRRTTPSSPGIRIAEIHVKLGWLTFEDTFFSADENYQRSLLMFELGKALWLQAESTHVQQAARQLLNFVTAHRAVLLKLKFAEFNGGDLGHLADNDDASLLGYALRALVLNLELPAGVDPRSEWQAVRREWTLARPELDRLMRQVLLQ